MTTMTLMIDPSLEKGRNRGEGGKCCNNKPCTKSQNHPLYPRHKQSLHSAQCIPNIFGTISIVKVSLFHFLDIGIVLVLLTTCLSKKKFGPLHSCHNHNCQVLHTTVIAIIRVLQISIDTEKALIITIIITIIIIIIIAIIIIIMAVSKHQHLSGSSHQGGSL